MKIREFWKGTSPTRGEVTCIITYESPRPHPAGGWIGGGGGYEPRFADGSVGEVKTIGLGDLDAARRFALTLGHGCPDVPTWCLAGREMHFDVDPSIGGPGHMAAVGDVVHRSGGAA